MEHEFGLRFQFNKNSADMETLVERLYEAGCDDAVVGVGQPGQVALEFVRAAHSAREAIVSALKDVKRAAPGAELIEVRHEFVDLTDVATRQ